ncbi:MAG: family 16 glycoside hydrolase [Planctomycetota bacterium]
MSFGPINAQPLAAVEPNVRLEPGLTFRLFEVGQPIDILRELAPDQTPNVDEKIDRLDLGADDFFSFQDRFVVRVRGYLKAETTGEYQFRLESDDGGRVRVGGKTIVEDDGLHAMREVFGSVELAAGLHRLDVEMFENAGGQGLRVAWQTPDSSDFEIIASDAVSTVANVTRVVSPGKKRLIGLPTPIGVEPRPGDRLPLESVHPGFVVETVRPSGFEPQVGAMAFLPNGMLAVTEFKPRNHGEFIHDKNGKLYVLDGVTGDDPEQVKFHLVAEGLHAPLGAYYFDEALFIADSDGIYKFTDRDEDGIPEHKERFAGGWEFDNYHQFTMNLVKRGKHFYTGLSTTIGAGSEIISGEVVGINGPNPAYRGTIARIHAENGSVSYIAGGFRTPNGLGLGPNNILVMADNQGAWKPANRIDVVREGEFYGFHGDTDLKTKRYPEGGVPTLFSDQEPVPAAVWLPQSEVSNSPTTPVLIEDGPFKDQMILGELTAGGMRRIALEQIAGVWQGVVFRFTQGFESGVNRIIKGPDGSYYAGGTGSTGNWSWRDTRFGLQRLRPVDGFGQTFEYETIRATADGFEVRYTQPIDPEWLADTENYRLKHFYYTPSPQYGGPKQGQQKLNVVSATPSTDGKSVRLVVEGRKPEHVVYFWTNPTSAAGETIWATEAWYTLNTWPGRPVPGIPADTEPTSRPMTDRANPPARDSLWQVKGDPPSDTHPWQVHDLKRPLPPIVEPGTASLQARAGRAPSDAIVLFDGNDPEANLDAWQPGNPKTGLTWHLGPGYFAVNPGAGPIRTVESFGDCQVHLEWMIPHSEETLHAQGRGNSGIFFLGRYEVQIGDHKDPPHTYADGMAGGVYGQSPPFANAGLGLDRWQTYDIIFRGPRFDAEGQLTRPATVTVLHNGVLVQDHWNLEGSTLYRKRAFYKPHGETAPLRLQDHGNPVRFRNVWVRPLADRPISAIE